MKQSDISRILETKRYKGGKYFMNVQCLKKVFVLYWKCCVRLTER